MKLQLAIIHLDMVFEKIELEEGEYTLGRSSQNNIVVQHFSLDAQHGKIFYVDGNWYYQRSEEKPPQKINNQRSITLSPQIEIATQEFVESGKTKLSDLQTARDLQQSKVNRRLGIVAGLLLFLGVSTVSGLFWIRHKKDGVSESRLLDRVRSKVVEFESTPDSQALADFKKFGGLSDSDFKENSGFCTGFLMGPNVVLTAAHCLMGTMVIDLNNDFYLKSHDGKKHKILEVLGFDIKRDYLYLRTEGMEEYGHLEFASDYQIEQKVYTVGNVHGEGIAIRDGIISSESTDPDDPEVKFLRYSAGTSPGNSGGPLVNKQGEVVALVFASTYSENFNLGTSVNDLRPAYEKYVTGGAETQNLTLALKRLLNFKAAPVLQALALPYLPQFDEHPEVAEKFKEIQIELPVPMDFATVDKTILEPLNKRIIEVYNEVQDDLRAKGEIVLDWKSFADKETPAILPSQFDESQSVFVKKNGRYYPLVAGLIDSPSKADFVKYKTQLKKEEKFDFQSYGYNIQIVDTPEDLLPLDIFYKPKDESGTKPRLQNLAYGAPHSQLLITPAEDPRTKGFYGIRHFLKHFAGKEGAIGSVYSRFVRPQSAKDFVIKDFDVEKERVTSEVVQDRLGRPWTLGRVQLFENLHILTYCTQLPEGTFCTGRAVNGYNQEYLRILEENYRQFILSHLLINPYFWSPTKLVEFLGQEKSLDFPGFRGVELRQDGNSLRGRLNPLGVEFEIPNFNRIQSVRVQSGLLAGDPQAQWAGYGLDWVQSDDKKDLVCGLGIEIFESQSTFILNFLRDRKKQEKLKKIKGEEAKPLPGVWYKPFRGMKTPFQIYGYCAPLEEDPRISGQYFVDFKNSKPFVFNHNVIGPK